MTVEPSTIGLIALAGYGLYSNGQRRGRKMRRMPLGGSSHPEIVPKTPLTIATDYSSWDMPETWIIQTAQPRFRTLIDEALFATKGDVLLAKEQGLFDPVAQTYRILQDEIGSCPVPFGLRKNGISLTFRELQADIPDRDDYYPYPAILGLFDTIYEAVEAALGVLEKTGDPGRSLLFVA